MINADDISAPFPTLLLGTAMWGWTTNKTTAFALLDAFYEKGFREIDTATNYPINRQPADFRRSENILAEWCNAHEIKDLRIISKVGSLDNMRSPIHNLAASFLLLNADYYRNLFGTNLETLMIHWDNREDEKAIKASYTAFEAITKSGLKVGLSGIRFPAIHARINQDFNFDFRIQLKHNLLHSDYERYAPFHGKRRFIAYGINAGGVKLNAHYSEQSSLRARGGNVSEQLPLVTQLQPILAKVNSNTTRPKLLNFNQLGLLYAAYQKDMNGILLGVSKMEQLEASIAFWKDLQRHDYSDVYAELLAVKK